MSLKSLKSRNKSVYRSGLEKKFAQAMPKGKYLYEPYDIPYTMHRKYKPDFVCRKTKMLIECKGFFRTGDTQKYTAIRDCLEEGQKLIFILADPNKKLRKGAKMTMGQWCTKEGFDFYTIDEYADVINNT